MSHVFISYSRKNTEHLSNLLNTLKQADVVYWYDSNDIPGGKEWRNEIDKAIDDAAVIVLIVTNEIWDSHYITYECARAMGNGIGLVPLLFEKLPPKPPSHPIVDRLQYIDFYANPVEALEAIKQEATIPQDTLYLDRLIFGVLRPLRFLALISTWLYPFILKGAVENDVVVNLIEKAQREAVHIYLEKLPELMVSKSYAFTSRQKRLCRNLLTQTHEFADHLIKLAYDVNNTYGDSTDHIAQVDGFRINVVEDAIGSFQRRDEFFDGFASYLRAIEYNQIGKRSLFEINLKEVFSDEDVDTIIKAIDAVRSSLSSGH